MGESLDFGGADPYHEVKEEVLQEAVSVVPKAVAPPPPVMEAATVELESTPLLQPPAEAAMISTRIFREQVLERAAALMAQQVLQGR